MIIIIIIRCVRAAANELLASSAAAAAAVEEVIGSIELLPGHRADELAPPSSVAVRTATAATRCHRLVSRNKYVRRAMDRTTDDQNDNIIIVAYELRAESDSAVPTYFHTHTQCPF